MLKSTLIAELQKEILQHDFSHFVDEPPSIAQGGRGVVVAGCPRCQMRLHSMNEFLAHLANDVVPAAVERVVRRGA